MGQQTRVRGAVRLVYAADLHGEIALYSALDRLVREAGAQALILGGDQFAHTRDPSEQLAFAQGPLDSWLRGLPVPIFVIAGNVDWPAATAALCGRARRLSLEPTAVGGAMGAIGYPFVPPTPFRQKWGERRDLRGESLVLPAGAYAPSDDGVARPLPPGWLDALPSIEDELSVLWGCDPERMVWVVHTPPYGCALDTTRSGAHVGSRALRAALEAAQPALALHGHIHESPVTTGRWVERIGRTVCVNPGRGASAAPLHAVVVDLDAQAGGVVGVWHTVWGDARLG